MLVPATNGLGYAESVRSPTLVAERPSSMPVWMRETLSAETSAQPPLQVPLSYANRSMVIFATASGSMPGRLVYISSARLSE
jgi:hypothetical protein